MSRDDPSTINLSNEDRTIYGSDTVLYFFYKFSRKRYSFFLTNENINFLVDLLLVRY